MQVPFLYAMGMQFLYTFDMGRLYVGVTDNAWYRYNKEHEKTEVNFWKPGTGSGFKVLQEGELFLFKLHSPYNAIAGGGFFVKYSELPVSMAWSAFGDENGASDLSTLCRNLSRHKKDVSLAAMMREQIGCRILTDVFWFDKEEWIPCPDDFSANIVSGKGYATETGTGKRLLQEVQARLRNNDPEEPAESVQEPERYTWGMAKHRIGQGAFRVMVADAYQRRCAVTGEKTFPVLEAAHIRSFADNGPNEVDNGLLLRSDLHTLYDQGYLAIDTDYTIAVSRRLHEDFDNGREYYAYDGKKLLYLPEDMAQRPSKEYLEWHNRNIFLDH